MIAEKTETMIDRQNISEADDTLRFLMILNKEEREEFNQFIKGARFGMQLAKGVKDNI